MNLINTARWIPCASLMLFAGTAAAHPGDHAVQDLAGGLAHPFLGLDHLLAMIAVGLWAAQQGGRARWAVPLAFVGTMLMGVGFAAAGIALPQVETGIALSVLVLGLLIATRRTWAVPVGMLIAAGFALFHGYAHGLDMPLAASSLPYMLGLVLVTGCLHGVGIAASLIGRRVIQWTGTGIASAGLALMIGV